MAKNYDLHSLFYYRVLALLKSFVDEDNQALPYVFEDEEAPVCSLGFTPRGDAYQALRHNFQRDKFLNNRDQLLYMKKNGDSIEGVVALRKVHNTDSIVIYQNSLRFIFGEDYEEARQELTQILKKFYYVTEAEQCELNRIDFSSSRGNSNEVRVHESQRV